VHPTEHAEHSLALERVQGDVRKVDPGMHSGPQGAHCVSFSTVHGETSNSSDSNAHAEHGKHSVSELVVHGDLSKVGRTNPLAESASGPGVAPVQTAQFSQTRSLDGDGLENSNWVKLEQVDSGSHLADDVVVGATDRNSLSRLQGLKDREHIRSDVAVGAAA